MKRLQKEHEKLLRMLGKKVLFLKKPRLRSESFLADFTFALQYQFFRASQPYVQELLNVNQRELSKNKENHIVLSFQSIGNHADLRHRYAELLHDLPSNIGFTPKMVKRSGFGCFATAV